MALTIEGLRVNTSIEALQQGEGFRTQVNASWNARDEEANQASRQAKRDGIIGSLLNGHEPTYADAEAAITARVNAFEQEIKDFITNWNSQQA